MKKLFWPIVGVCLGVIIVAVSVISVTEPKRQTFLAFNESGDADRGIAFDLTSPAPAVMMKGEVIMNDDAFSRQTVGVADRLIVRNGNIALVVENVYAVSDEISRLAVENGGFVVSGNIWKTGVKPAGEISVRVPADKFVAIVASVKALGEVKRESLDGRDITEEYVDLDARLKAMEAVESRLLNVLARAGEISDILAVEIELKNTRLEIESLQGRMKYLSEAAAMSLLTVSLATDPSSLPSLDESDSWKPLGVLKSAWRALVALTKGLANLLIWLAVFAPVWLVIGGLAWLILRKNRKKR